MLFCTLSNSYSICRIDTIHISIALPSLQWYNKDFLEGGSNFICASQLYNPEHMQKRHTQIDTYNPG